MSGQLALAISEQTTVPAAVWETLPLHVHRQVTIVLARLLRRLIAGAMSEPGKVSDRHRRRTAVVYVRQSTPGQVARNTESAARQRALAHRAVALGWPAGSVVVVDEDTGTSAASMYTRIGFRELVAQVGLGQVGVILALEVSRLARCSAEWHQLLDLCALTGTLIADDDGIYSPGEFNDRLLLGLKGTMSEAELHLIRSRLRGGLESKARRGELRLNLPVGLERDEDDQIRLCADEQVRAAIERVYELWARCASARQVVAELAGEGERLPRRTVGDRRIRWEPASFGAVHDLLTNPAYAGAFAYGQSRQARTVAADSVSNCTPKSKDYWTHPTAPNNSTSRTLLYAERRECQRLCIVAAWPLNWWTDADISPFCDVRPTPIQRRHPAGVVRKRGLAVATVPGLLDRGVEL
jgi:DNA invertase Pin-like site-specific DNA recombinase